MKLPSRNLSIPRCLCAAMLLMCLQARSADAGKGTFSLLGGGLTSLGGTNQGSSSELGFRLGYIVDKKLTGSEFGFEAGVNYLPSSLGSEQDTQSYQLRVDGWYPVFTKDRLTSYLAVGTGIHGTTEGGVSPLVNAGAGLDYHLGNSFALTSNLRYLVIVSENASNSNIEFNVGIKFLFSKPEETPRVLTFIKHPAVITSLKNAKLARPVKPSKPETKPAQVSLIEKPAPYRAKVSPAPARSVDAKPAASVATAQATAAAPVTVPAPEPVIAPVIAPVAAPVAVATATSLAPVAVETVQAAAAPSVESSAVAAEPAVPGTAVAQTAAPVIVSALPPDVPATSLQPQPASDVTASKKVAEVAAAPQSVPAVPSLPSRIPAPVETREIAPLARELHTKETLETVDPTVTSATPAASPVAVAVGTKESTAPELEAPTAQSVELKATAATAQATMPTPQAVATLPAPAPPVTGVGTSSVAPLAAVATAVAAVGSPASETSVTMSKEPIEVAPVATAEVPALAEPVSPLAPVQKQAAAPAVESAVSAATPVKPGLSELTADPTGAPAVPAAAAAASLAKVVITPEGVLIGTDGVVTEYRSFTLVKPARLVVDIRGVENKIQTRKIVSAVSGISGARIAGYPDKVRVVIDSNQQTFPPAKLVSTPEGLRVLIASTPDGESAPTTPPPETKAGDGQGATAAGKSGATKSSAAVTAPAPLTVDFDFDSTLIHARYHHALNTICQKLKKSPATRVRIDGHTDNVGSNGYNLKLSRSRADQVKRFLVQSGAAASQITTSGYGATRPVADNSTEEGRKKNRRAVTITVQEKK